MQELANSNAIVNDKLLARIPAAGRILELGCGDGRLGRAYKAAYPRARWVGVEPDAHRAEGARQVLDRVVCGDPERDGFDWPEAPYDVVVIESLLEYVRRPRELLRRLLDTIVPDGVLLCRVRNMTHHSMLAQLLRGDLTCRPQGPLVPGQAGLWSESSAAKLLLDAGWMPDAQDRELAGTADAAVLEALAALAGHLRIPPATAQRYLLTSHTIFRCIRAQAAPRAVGPAPFSVVVPVNDREQFDLNIAASPGLGEIQADVLACRNTPSAGEAFEFGCGRVATEWVLFCHQDVYFPSGSGDALVHALGQSLAADPQVEVIGFAGVCAAQTAPRASGLVLDRGTLFDHPGSDRAESIDEFAVLLRRGRVQLDRALGWHLWGTDLCLRRLSTRAPARIVRVPLFHNSYNAYELPPDFQASLEVLKGRFPDRRPIRSLCGTFY